MYSYKCPAAIYTISLLANRDGDGVSNFKRSFFRLFSLFGRLRHLYFLLNIISFLYFVLITLLKILNVEYQWIVDKSILIKIMKYVKKYLLLS